MSHCRSFLRSLSIPSAIFYIEQPLLPIQPPRVAAQRAIFADHAMAWDDDAERIFPIRAACGAHGPGRSDPSRQFRIADGLAERNLRQLRPHFLLEFCS